MRTQDLRGVWMIRSFQIVNARTGEFSKPWGDRPSGTLIFDAGGRMFALITAEGRKPPETEKNQANAYREMLAYSGRYRVDPPDRLVTMVDVSWFEPWLGTEQVRYCELTGDDLKLTSAPLNMPQNAEKMVAVVMWKREAGLPVSNSPSKASSG